MFRIVPNESVSIRIYPDLTGSIRIYPNNTHTKQSPCLRKSVSYVMHRSSVARTRNTAPTTAAHKPTAKSTVSHGNLRSPLMKYSGKIARYFAAYGSNAQRWFPVNHSSPMVTAWNITPTSSSLLAAIRISFATTLDFNHASRPIQKWP